MKLPVLLNYLEVNGLFHARVVFILYVYIWNMCGGR
jgi:hypothetical protein